LPQAREFPTRAAETEAALIDDGSLPRGYSPENQGTGLLANALGRGRSQDDSGSGHPVVGAGRRKASEAKRRWSADDSENECRNKRGILATALSNRVGPTKSTGSVISSDAKKSTRREEKENDHRDEKRKQPKFVAKKPGSSSSSTSSEKETDESDKVTGMSLLDIMKLEPSTRLLYLAKKSEWKKVDELLGQRTRLDFAMVDVVSRPTWG
jgi:hypothetical protein